MRASQGRCSDPRGRRSRGSSSSWSSTAYVSLVRFDSNDNNISLSSLSLSLSLSLYYYYHCCYSFPRRHQSIGRRGLPHPPRRQPSPPLPPRPGERFHVCRGRLSLSDAPRRRKFCGGKNLKLAVDHDFLSTYLSIALLLRLSFGVLRLPSWTA